MFLLLSVGLQHCIILSGTTAVPPPLLVHVMVSTLLHGVVPPPSSISFFLHCLLVVSLSLLLAVWYVVGSRFLFLVGSIICFNGWIIELHNYDCGRSPMKFVIIAAVLNL